MLQTQVQALTLTCISFNAPQTTAPADPPETQQPGEPTDEHLLYVKKTSVGRTHSLPNDSYMFQPLQPNSTHSTHTTSPHHAQTGRALHFISAFVSNADIIWNVIEKYLLTQGLQALFSLKQKKPHCTWLCPPICSDRSVLIAYRTQSASHESPHLAGHTLSHELYADRWAQVQSSQSFHCFFWNVFCLQSLFLWTHVDALWFCWLHIVSLFQNLVSCLDT